MNEELRELIREIITRGNLNANLVDLTYELELDYTVSDKLERLSLVYEVITEKGDEEQ